MIQNRDAKSDFVASRSGGSGISSPKSPPSKKQKKKSNVTQYQRREWNEVLPSIQTNGMEWKENSILIEGDHRAGPWELETSEILIEGDHRAGPSELETSEILIEGDHRAGPSDFVVQYTKDKCPPGASKGKKPKDQCPDKMLEAPDQALVDKAPLQGKGDVSQQKGKDKNSAKTGKLDNISEHGKLSKTSKQGKPDNSGEQQGPDTSGEQGKSKKGKKSKFTGERLNTTSAFKKSSSPEEITHDLSQQFFAATYADTWTTTVAAMTRETIVAGNHKANYKAEKADSCHQSIENDKAEKAKRKAERDAVREARREKREKRAELDPYYRENYYNSRGRSQGGGSLKPANSPSVSVNTPIDGFYNSNLDGAKKKKTDKKERKEARATKESTEKKEKKEEKKTKKKERSDKKDKTEEKEALLPEKQRGNFDENEEFFALFKPNVSDSNISPKCNSTNSSGAGSKENGTKRNSTHSSGGGSTKVSKRLNNKKIDWNEWAEGGAQGNEWTMHNDWAVNDIWYGIKGTKKGKRDWSNEWSLNEKWSTKKGKTSWYGRGHDWYGGESDWHVELTKGSTKKSSSKKEMSDTDGSKDESKRSGKTSTESEWSKENTPSDKGWEGWNSWGKENRVAAGAKISFNEGSGITGTATVTHSSDHSKMTIPVESKVIVSGDSKMIMSDDDSASDPTAKPRLTRRQQGMPADGNGSISLEALQDVSVNDFWGTPIIKKTPQKTEDTTPVNLTPSQGQADALVDGGDQKNQAAMKKAPGDDWQPIIEKSEEKTNGDKLIMGDDSRNTPPISPSTPPPNQVAPTIPARLNAYDYAPVKTEKTNIYRSSQIQTSSGGEKGGKSEGSASGSSSSESTDQSFLSLDRTHVIEDVAELEESLKGVPRRDEEVLALCDIDGVIFIGDVCNKSQKKLYRLYFDLKNCQVVHNLILDFSKRFSGRSSANGFTSGTSRLNSVDTDSDSSLLNSDACLDVEFRKCCLDADFRHSKMKERGYFDLAKRKEGVFYLYNDALPQELWNFANSIRIKAVEAAREFVDKETDGKISEIMKWCKKTGLNLKDLVQHDPQIINTYKPTFLKETLAKHPHLTWAMQLLSHTLPENLTNKSENNMIKGTTPLLDPLSAEAAGGVQQIGTAYGGIHAKGYYTVRGMRKRLHQFVKDYVRLLYSNMNEGKSGGAKKSKEDTKTRNEFNNKECDEENYKDYLKWLKDLNHKNRVNIDSPIYLNSQNVGSSVKTPRYDDAKTASSGNYPGVNNMANMNGQHVRKSDVGKTHIGKTQVDLKPENTDMMKKPQTTNELIKESTNKPESTKTQSTPYMCEPEPMTHLATPHKGPVQLPLFDTDNVVGERTPFVYNLCYHYDEEKYNRAYPNWTNAVAERSRDYSHHCIRDSPMPECSWQEENYSLLEATQFLLATPQLLGNGVERLGYHVASHVYNYLDSQMIGRKKLGAHYEIRTIMRNHPRHVISEFARYEVSLTSQYFTLMPGTEFPEIHSCFKKSNQRLERYSPRFFDAHERWMSNMVCGTLVDAVGSEYNFVECFRIQDYGGKQLSNGHRENSDVIPNAYNSKVEPTGTKLSTWPLHDCVMFDYTGTDLDKHKCDNSVRSKQGQVHIRNIVPHVSNLDVKKSKALLSKNSSESAPFGASRTFVFGSGNGGFAPTCGQTGDSSETTGGNVDEDLGRRSLVIDPSLLRIPADSFIFAIDWDKEVLTDEGNANGWDDNVGEEANGWDNHGSSSKVEMNNVQEWSNMSALGGPQCMCRNLAALHSQRDYYKSPYSCFVEVALSSNCRSKPFLINLTSTQGEGNGVLRGKSFKKKHAKDPRKHVPIEQGQLHLLQNYNVITLSWTNLRNNCNRSPIPVGVWEVLCDIFEFSYAFSDRYPHGIGSKPHVVGHSRGGMAITEMYRQFHPFVNLSSFWSMSHSIMEKCDARGLGGSSKLNKVEKLVHAVIQGAGGVENAIDKNPKRIHWGSIIALSPYTLLTTSHNCHCIGLLMTSTHLLGGHMNNANHLFRKGRRIVLNDTMKEPNSKLLLGDGSKVKEDHCYQFSEPAYCLILVPQHENWQSDCQYLLTKVRQLLSCPLSRNYQEDFWKYSSYMISTGYSEKSVNRKLHEDKSLNTTSSKVLVPGSGPGRSLREDASAPLRPTPDGPEDVPTVQKIYRTLESVDSLPRGFVMELYDEVQTHGICCGFCNDCDHDTLWDKFMGKSHLHEESQRLLRFLPKFWSSIQGLHFSPKSHDHQVYATSHSLKSLAPSKGLQSSKDFQRFVFTYIRNLQTGDYTGDDGSIMVKYPTKTIAVLTNELMGIVGMQGAQQQDPQDQQQVPPRQDTGNQVPQRQVPVLGMPQRPTPQFASGPSQYAMRPPAGDARVGVTFGPPQPSKIGTHSVRSDIYHGSNGINLQSTSHAQTEVNMQGHPKNDANIQGHPTNKVNMQNDQEHPTMNYMKGARTNMSDTKADGVPHASKYTLGGQSEDDGSSRNAVDSDRKDVDCDRKAVDCDRMNEDGSDGRIAPVSMTSRFLINKIEQLNQNPMPWILNRLGLNNQHFQQITRQSCHYVLECFVDLQTFSNLNLGSSLNLGPSVESSLVEPFGGDSSVGKRLRKSTRPVATGLYTNRPVTDSPRGKINDRRLSEVEREFVRHCCKKLNEYLREQFVIPLEQEVLHNLGTMIGKVEQYTGMKEAWLRKQRALAKSNRYYLEVYDKVAKEAAKEDGILLLNPEMIVVGSSPDEVYFLNKLDDLVKGAHYKMRTIRGYYKLLCVEMLEGWWRKKVFHHGTTKVPTRPVVPTNRAEHDQVCADFLQTSHTSYAEYLFRSGDIDWDLSAEVAAV